MTRKNQNTLYRSLWSRLGIGCLQSRWPKGAEILAPVQLLYGRVRWRPGFLQPRRDSLGTAESSQQVLAGELAQIGVGPAAANQLSEQVRILGDVFQALRLLAVSGKVGGNADVVRAGDFADVLNVICHLLERGRRRWAVLLA